MGNLQLENCRLQKQLSSHRDMRFTTKKCKTDVKLRTVLSQKIQEWGEGRNEAEWCIHHLYAKQKCRFRLRSWAAVKSWRSMFNVISKHTVKPHSLTLCNSWPFTPMKEFSWDVDVGQTGQAQSLRMRGFDTCLHIPTLWCRNNSISRRGSCIQVAACNIIT